MPHRLTPDVIESEEALRAVVGEPLPVVVSKIASRLHGLTRRFIEESPFVCIATSDADGRCDVSPRGDPKGFVRILDDATLLVPERPGNRLADSLRNVLMNPRVGLLFVIPGVGDTLRVNGRAAITTSRELLEPSTIEGKVPKLGLLIDIEEAYTQCPKAFIRSDLWNAAHHVDPKTLPTGGAILAEQQGASFDGAAYDEARAKRYARREGFY